MLGALGAGISLTVAASVALLVVSTVVAFRGWPEDLGGAGPAAVSQIAADGQLATPATRSARVRTVALAPAVARPVRSDRSVPRASGGGGATAHPRPGTGTPAPGATPPAPSAPAPSAASEGSPARRTAADAAGQVVQETTAATGEAIQTTTKQVGDAVSPVSPAVGKLVDSAGRTTGGAVENAGGVVGGVLP